MVLSNEPGYYQNGDWGIRIENLIVVIRANNPNFLQFETITLCPLERRLIDKSLLNAMKLAGLIPTTTRCQQHCFRIFLPRQKHG